jgi:hypothetical protein
MVANVEETIDDNMKELIPEPFILCPAKQLRNSMGRQRIAKDASINWNHINFCRKCICYKKIDGKEYCNHQIPEDLKKKYEEMK